MDPRCLIGAETEFGVYAEDRGGVRPAPPVLAGAIVEEMGRRHTHVASAQPLPLRRIYLANGACVYADIGGHPELASAECASPMDLAAQTIALRQMLAEAASAVGEAYQLPVRLICNNVDYAVGDGGATYGFHLNVLLRQTPMKEMVRQLTPLLVAMPVLAGAGKFSTAATAAGFELSQRAGYMCSVMSRHTTESRAMATAKDESLSKPGDARLHLISLDTCMSPWQLLLVPAVVALSAKAVEAGSDIGGRLALADPVNALQRVSCDPSLRAALPLDGGVGGAVTALEILEAYRVMVEQRLDQGCLPSWAEAIVALWSEMLGNLRDDPYSEYSRLDWTWKLLAFSRQLEKEGLSWSELSRWAGVLAYVGQLKATWPELDPNEMDGPERVRREISRPAMGVLESQIARRGLAWEVLPSVWGITNRLRGICIQHHTLTTEPPSGEPVIRPCPLVDPQSIEAAKTTPPVGTRAAIRGRAIREADADATADWGFVASAGRLLTMNDAFGEDASWEDSKA